MVRGHRDSSRELRRLGLVHTHAMSTQLAQADGIIPNQPDDGAAWVVFVIVGAVLGGVYWLIRRSRRRSVEAYWERRERDELRRLTDPDMARQPEPDEPHDD